MSVLYSKIIEAAVEDQIKQIINAGTCSLCDKFEILNEWEQSRDGNVECDSCRKILTILSLNYKKEKEQYQRNS